MKKKTITIGALLLAMTCFSQTDTLAYSISGKNKYEFDYYTSEIEKIAKPKVYKDFKFKLKKNEFLYLDLFDDVEPDALYSMHRHITVYYRDGSIKELSFDSDDSTLQFNGVSVKKLVVHRQELK